jgi:polyisoprenoid-binding protein YceI
MSRTRPLTTMEVMSEATASGHPVTAPAPGRYRVVPEYSTVTFTTRHLFGLGRVRGTMALRDGLVEVAEPPGRSLVTAQVAVSTFRTGNEQRDVTVLSPRLLDAQAHPAIAFTSTGLAPSSGATRAPEGDSNWTLIGELTVRGTARPVEAAVTGVTVTDGGAELRAAARLRVDRYAFGVTGYRGLAARWLTVDVDLYAERTA